RGRGANLRCGRGRRRSIGPPAVQVHSTGWADVGMSPPTTYDAPTGCPLKEFAMKRPPQPTVLLSAFGDEAAVGKTAVEQLGCMSALGLCHYSVRFVDLGGGVKNVMKLDDEELSRLRALHHQYDMKVTSIGSPIGKVKLVDVKDGTHNVYRPFDEYLENEVVHA